MNIMQRRFKLPVGLALLAGICSAQTPAHRLEIKLPPGLNSETFFARYVLTGQDFGKWVPPLSHVSSYTIDTTHATGIQAIFYAPGCAIQTLSLSLSDSNDAQYPFVCQPVASIRLAGAVVHPARLYEHGAKLQAKYVARWAQRFLNLDEVVMTDIPVGDVASVDRDGRFELIIPDLTQDPLAKAPNHPGELQIWAKDKSTQAILSQLIPIEPQSIKARMGGLKMQTAYPLETVFVQCEANSSSISGHDKFGFGFRGDTSGACVR